MGPSDGILFFQAPPNTTIISYDIYYESQFQYQPMVSYGCWFTLVLYYRGICSGKRISFSGKYREKVNIASNVTSSSNSRPKICGRPADNIPFLEGLTFPSHVTGFNYPYFGGILKQCLKNNGKY